MDGTALHHQDGLSSPSMPNGQFVPPGGHMMNSYNCIPPPLSNYYNNQAAQMQHRPDMPSTSSNGSFAPLQFPPQPQGFSSPMDGSNAGFYGNGLPAPPYFTSSIPTTPSVMPNNYPPEYPQMPHRVPSTPSATQARASPFAPMHGISNGNGSMTPTYPMPGQAKTPNMFVPGAGRSTPTGGNSGFVFTTEMANRAAIDVGQGKQYGIAQWHSQNQISMSATLNQSGGRKSAGGVRNSPSYSTTAASTRKRKGSQAQERQNPTPSPQLSHQPGSVPEFKQPMSNHAPGSVPDSSVMQFGLDQQKQIKQEPSLMHQVKAEMSMASSSGQDQDPLKQIEIMINQKDSSMPPKLTNQMPDSGVKRPNEPNKAAKLARLNEIEQSIVGMEKSHHPQYPPQMYGNFPTNGMPPPHPHMRFMPNGPIMSSNVPPYQMAPNGPPNQPPMYYPPSGMGMPQNEPMSMYNSNGPMPSNPMDMNSPAGMPMHNGPPQMPPGYMPPNQRFPMPQSNGIMLSNMRPPMPYPPPPTDMGMLRPPNQEMFNQWNESMPQPLANLDSRVPSQKINYYAGNVPPPPQSNTPTHQSLKNIT